MIWRSLLYGRQNWKICENNFLLLARSPYHRCDVRVISEAINQGDGKGMKVACIRHVQNGQICKHFN